MISDQQIAQFEELGYFTVSSLITREEIAATCAEITRVVCEGADLPAELIQWEPSVASRRYEPESLELGVRKLFRVAKHLTFFRGLAQHPKLLGIADALLGSQLVLMQSMLLMKPPHCSTDKVWHQDNAYFRVDPPELLGFWIACDEATVENGCMHIVPGSHKQGLVHHDGPGDEYGAIEQPAEEDVLAIPLRPGEALVFHGELLHFTPANRTQQRRRALQYHYAASGLTRRLANHGLDLPVELEIAPHQL